MDRFFCEERTINGGWRACTYTYRPPEKGPEGRLIKRRAVTKIPACFAHLSLDQLQAVCGSNGHLKATQKGGAEPSP